MRRATPYLIAFLCALLLTACAGAANALEPAITELVKNGDLTPEQGKMVLSAVAGGFDWGALGDKALNTAITLVLGYFGIRQWRGTPAKRKGSSPS